jgi:hypothetical protein
MLEILDSLIATIGVVLVLSLIVQAIQQIIKQSCSLKSKYMERELFAMFQQNVVAPGVQSLTETLKEGIEPIWMKFKAAGKTDSNASKVVDLLREKLKAIGYNDLSLLETLKKDDLKNLLARISAEVDKQLASGKDDAVSKLLRDSKSALSDAVDNVEHWYDLTMKAFQDHYERRMKLWSYMLSFLVVVWLNQNLFSIYREFSTNKTLRDSAVKMAERLTSIPRDSLIRTDRTAPVDSTKVSIDSLAMKSIQRNIAYIDSLVSSQSYHVMRWDFPKTEAKYLDWIGERTWFVVTEGVDNLFGWLAMTLLVGLGAPFWYDFLKTVMGVKDVLKSKSKGQT